MLTKKNIFRAILIYALIQIVFLYIKVDLNIDVVINNDVSWWVALAPSIVIGVIAAIIVGMLSTLKM